MLAIAHRAGNNVQLALEAAKFGADFVEADVRLHHSRLEVRHLKTLPHLSWVPILWDRWRIAPGWGRRLLLPALLEGVHPETGMMLDLKEDEPGLPDAIMTAMKAAPRLRYAVCGQHWPYIDAFVGMPGILALHSIGNERQLEVMLDAGYHGERHGFSVHRKLLNVAVVSKLRAIAPFVITWPINDDASLAEVTSYGVDGVTTDSMDVLQRVVRERMAPEPST